MRMNLLSIAGAVMLAPFVCSAQNYHPEYLHARSDLRLAEWIIRGFKEQNVRERMREADAEIDKAIGELDRASIYDRKNLNEHPQVDADVERRGRFWNALRLLQSARRDIESAETNTAALGWRDSAFRHIDAAIWDLRKSAKELHYDHELANPN